MLLREVEYARPATVDEAVALLSGYDGARALAGGQTLLNVMKARAASPDVLVDLNALDELRTIGFSGDGLLEIGAMVTYAQLVASSEVEVARPILAEVADDDRRRPGAEPRYGRRQRLRERSDESPAAAPRRARGDVHDPRRRRASARCSADEFFLGVYMTAVGEGELLTKISVPPSSGCRRRLRGRHHRRAGHVRRERGRDRLGRRRPHRDRLRRRVARAGDGDGGEARGRRLLARSGRCGRGGARRLARPAVGRPRLGRLSASSRRGLGDAGGSPGGRAGGRAA